MMGSFNSLLWIFLWDSLVLRKAGIRTTGPEKLILLSQPNRLLEMESVSLLPHPRFLLVWLFPREPLPTMFSMLHPLDEITPLVWKSGGRLDVPGVPQGGSKSQCVSLEPSLDQKIQEESFQGCSWSSCRNRGETQSKEGRRCGKCSQCCCGAAPLECIPVFQGCLDRPGCSTWPTTR